MRTLYHPTREQITLPGVLEALSDPTRLAIVLQLAEARDEMMCSHFLDFGSKTNLSYHFAKLREAGVTSARVAGTRRYLAIRWDDLEARFPGLLKQLLAAAKREPVNPLPEGYMAPANERRPAKRAKRSRATASAA